jgi:solute carrier family 6 (neurotransmitter transporter, glycine) member 5/9
MNIKTNFLLYRKEIFNETSGLSQGIGYLNWNLVGFLAVSWCIVLLILAKGIKSSGKASYFLAIFPYIMLVTLLVKTLTLEGSFDGIVYLFKPQWDKILEPSVWFAAVTQVFFNIYRDANIVTTLDTFTSLLAGCCVFAVLGHLKHELGVEDIRDVMKGGPGVAFISYPETIAKFKNFSQFFSILFFFMLYVLGIGSNVAMTSCLVTEIKDHFHQVKNWQATLIVAIFGTFFGSIYYTQVSSP